MKLNTNTIKSQDILKLVHHEELQGNNYYPYINEYNEDDCNRKY